MDIITAADMTQKPSKEPGEWVNQYRPSASNDKNIHNAVSKLPVYYLRRWWL